MKNMRNPNWKRFGLGLALFAGTLVSVVWAYDSKFDLAIDNIVKAKALIVAATQPATNPANQAQLDLLRRQAHQHLKLAEESILQATVLSDAP